MFHRRVDFDFKSENIPDWMHNLGRVFLMLINIICGALGTTTRAKQWATAGYDHRHRAECELFEIFPSIWLEQTNEIPDDVRAALLRVTDADIATATRPTLELWCRAVGENPRGVLVDELRQKVGRLFVRIRQPGPFVFTPQQLNPLLPWRLSAAAFTQVDRRVCSMIYPPGIEAVVVDGPCMCDCMFLCLILYMTHMYVCRKIFSKQFRCIFEDQTKIVGTTHNFTDCFEGFHTGTTTWTLFFCSWLTYATRSSPFVQQVHPTQC